MPTTTLRYAITALAFLLLSRALFSSDTQKHVLTGAIYPLLNQQITASATDHHALVNVAVTCSPKFSPAKT